MRWTIGNREKMDATQSPLELPVPSIHLSGPPWLSLTCIAIVLVVGVVKINTMASGLPTMTCYLWMKWKDLIGK
jgi:hypothetical protein